ATVADPDGVFPGGIVDTNLVLLPCGADLRQDNDGPVTTKAKFDIWNENEVRFSGTERCITCWDLAPLREYTVLGAANHFLIDNLQTDRGKARVQGLGSQVCEGSEDAALLGLVQKAIEFPTVVGKAAIPMSVQGYEPGWVLFDLSQPPEERRSPEGL
ncbi:MAG: hypothetical protein KJ749_07800, partial [Planctomycetes bacterium]|nr:hypothetical protein [Planctomycetota bacterium]